MRRRKRGLLGAVVATLVGVAGAALLAWGLLALGQDRDARASFEELARSTVVEPADGDGGGGHDWEALLSAQPGTCAWLTVEGTTVDVPVMRAYAEDPEFWLYRGLDGGHSDVGTPYLDHRCSPDGRVGVVYGHRTLYESYVFHDLSGAYDQGAFDGLGTAAWETQALGTTPFAPLCSASVDKSDGNWRRFAFATVDELREWLTWCVGAASARSAGAEALAGEATRCLVLVTCNGRPLYPETRTVTIFVSPATF